MDGGKKLGGGKFKKGLDSYTYRSGIIDVEI
jgi:hypothetical protein